MQSLWRIVDQKHSGEAFTGYGAAKFGGRWNSRGTAIVYCSETMSLAILETLIHLDPWRLMKYESYEVKCEESVIERIPLSALTDGWNSETPKEASTTLGDAWVREARTAVLAVPSVVIPSETNYLLNPAHPDFNQITICDAKPFVFDRRLLR